MVTILIKAGHGGWQVHSTHVNIDQAIGAAHAYFEDKCFWQAKHTGDAEATLLAIDGHGCLYEYNSCGTLVTFTM